MIVVGVRKQVLNPCYLEVLMIYFSRRALAVNRLLVHLERVGLDDEKLRYHWACPTCPSRLTQKKLVM